MRLYLSTGNKHKLKEASSILSGIDLTPMDNSYTIEESGNSFQENADIKSLYLSKIVQDYVIADDSGLVCKGLNGVPGIYSSRYAGEKASDNDNILKLLADMYNIVDRTAFFVCNISLSKGGRVVANFEGVLKGSISYVPKGSNGFGYDPIFILPDGRHLSELADDEKNRISHRYIALIKLKNYLNGLK